MSLKLNKSNKAENTALLQEVRKHYKEEYLSKTPKLFKGFLLGACAHTLLGSPTKDPLLNGLIFAFTLGFGVSIFGGTFGGAVVTMLLSTSLNVYVARKMEKFASIEMEKDIASGNLTQRYVDEVLSPNLEAGRLTVEALTKPKVAALSTATTFETAATKSGISADDNKVDPAAGIIPTPKK